MNARSLDFANTDQVFHSEQIANQVFSPSSLLLLTLLPRGRWIEDMQAIGKNTARGVCELKE
jgi:hypothetical protein